MRRRTILVATWVFVITCQLIYAIHTNLGHAGMIVSASSLNDIPTELQPYLKFQNHPIILILSQPFPVGATIPRQQATIAVITDQSFPIGTVVEVVNPIVDWQVDSRLLLPSSEYFDRLLISDMVVAVQPIEAGNELVLLSPVGPIAWAAGYLGFYGGPLFFVLESFLLDKRPRISSFLLAVSGYSLGMLFSASLASEHLNYLSPTFRYFGDAFPALLLLVVLVWRYERSDAGKRFTEKLWGTMSG